MNKVKCNTCGKEYTERGIHTHIWRTHGEGMQHEPNKARKIVNELSCCVHCKVEINFRSLKRHTSNCALVPKNQKLCRQCNKLLVNTNTTFCSRSCGAIHSNARKDYSKFKSGPTKTKSMLPRYTMVDWLVCPVTGKLFLNRNSKGNKRRNSPFIKRRNSPFINNRRKHYNGNPLLYDYRQKCKFKVNVYDYPDKFNLQLIEDVGWYSPSNRGNNLAGVSRDHMLSVKYGFDNNIDPEIIGHPANLQLLIQSKNASKSSKSSITLAELLVRIENW